MIILKILLYILLAVLGVVLLVIMLALALPTVAEVSYTGGKLTYKVRFSFIRLIDSDGKGLVKRIKKRRKKVPEEDFSDDDDEEDDGWEEEDFPDIEEFSQDYESESEEDCEEITEEESDEDKARAEKIRRIKAKKSAEKAEKNLEKTAETDGKTLGDKIGSLLDIWETGGRPLLKVFRGFHIDKIFIDFIVADEDAYKCAVNYGRVSAVTYNLLAWLGELFTVSYKTVDIRSGFSLKKSQWDASCKVSFRLYTLAFSTVWFLWVYWFKILTPREKSKKSKKRGKKHE
ncbi:MAG: hypothetical protein K2J08_11490 [Ruminococcus sp.]|nr:hypothetical protein [Ruminococcus sp.]